MENMEESAVRRVPERREGSERAEPPSVAASPIVPDGGKQ